MSKDISTQFTKERNKECGRRGYGFWKKEKDDSDHIFRIMAAIKSLNNG